MGRFSKYFFIIFLFAIILFNIHPAVAAPHNLYEKEEQEIEKSVLYEKDIIDSAKSGFMQRQKEVSIILIEALDLINELDENIGIETNNYFTMDFGELRRKITEIIDLRK